MNHLDQSRNNLLSGFIIFLKTNCGLCFHIMRPHIPAATPVTRLSLESIFKHRRTNFTLICDGLQWPRSYKHNSKSQDKTTSSSTTKGTAGQHKSALIGQLRQLWFICLNFKISAQNPSILRRQNMLKTQYGGKKHRKKLNPLQRRQKESPDYSVQKASLKPLNDAGGWAEMKR